MTFQSAVNVVISRIVAPDYILREFQFQPSHPRYWSQSSAIEPVLAIPTVGSFSRNKKEERQRW